jgi:nucleoside-diphosphate-sugar epimerase
VGLGAGQTPSRYVRRDGQAILEAARVTIKRALNPKPSYLVLHRPSRLHFKSDSPLHWPKDYIKFCATYSYVPDIAAGLATLGMDARAAGQVWHLPGPQTVTTRALLDLVAGEAGHPVAIRSVPRLAVRALGLINPMMRELAEMAYEFDEPFILDTTRFQTTFGPAGTRLATAIAATVDWYRNPYRHALTEAEAEGDDRHD